MADLTTEWAQYLKDLKAASPTATDISTLVQQDLPTVRAAHPLETEVDDVNTLYLIHLD